MKKYLERPPTEFHGVFNLKRSGRSVKPHILFPMLLDFTSEWQSAQIAWWNACSGCKSPATDQKERRRLVCYVERSGTPIARLG